MGKGLVTGLRFDRPDLSICFSKRRHTGISSGLFEGQRSTKNIGTGTEPATIIIVPFIHPYPQKHK